MTKARQKEETPAPAEAPPDEWRSEVETDGGITAALKFCKQHDQATAGIAKSITSYRQRAWSLFCDGGSALRLRESIGRSMSQAAEHRARATIQHLSERSRRELLSTAEGLERGIERNRKIVAAAGTGATVENQITRQKHVADLLHAVQQTEGELSAFAGHPLLARSPEAAALREKLYKAKLAHHAGQEALAEATEVFQKAGRSVTTAGLATREVALRAVESVLMALGRRALEVCSEGGRLAFYGDNPGDAPGEIDALRREAEAGAGIVAALSGDPHGLETFLGAAGDDVREIVAARAGMRSMGQITRPAARAAAL